MGQHERLRFLPEQGADAVDQLRVAAAVGGECVVVFGIFGRLQISVNIGTAKAVNRLFGVAHEKQRVAVGDKSMLENGVLQRVGVLKFVDQRHAPVFRHGFGQKRTLRALTKRVVHIEQQIVEAALAAAFFLLDQRVVDVGE